MTAKMRKIERLVKKYNEKVGEQCKVYFADSRYDAVPLDDDYYGYRYFLIYPCTFHVARCAKTQDEFISTLEEMIAEDERDDLYAYRKSEYALINEIKSCNDAFEHEKIIAKHIAKGLHI